MKRLLLILSMTALSCVQVVATVTPTAPPAATPTATEIVPHVTATPSPAPLGSTTQETAQVIAASVNVRQTRDSAEIVGYVYAGQEVVIISCGGDWCEIAEPVAGYVFRGCLSDNPEKLKCEAR